MGTLKIWKNNGNSVFLLEKHLEVIEIWVKFQKIHFLEKQLVKLWELIENIGARELCFLNKQRLGNSSVSTRLGLCCSAPHRRSVRVFPLQVDTCRRNHESHSGWPAARHRRNVPDARPAVPTDGSTFVVADLVAVGKFGHLANTPA